MSKALIIADLEDNCAATPRGLHLAGEMDLQPEVVAFTYTDLKRLKVDAGTATKIKQQMLAERRATVESRIEAIAGINHGVKIHTVWAEDIHSWIIKRAAGDYDVVVKSRHRSESFGHVSTDWHLLRDCPAPVLLVGKKKWKRGAPIVATVDLEATSKAKQKLNVDVIREARHYAEILDTPLQILCVVDVPAMLAELDLIDPHTWAKQRVEELKPVMEKLAETTGLPKSSFRFKRGPVAKTIVSEAADARAQLVVMGTVGRKGVKGKLMGNTAEATLGLLKTDVLALKP